MNNELTVKGEALPSAQLADWGAPQVSTQDVIIPKILPMQGLSDLVVARKAMIGEFRDSVSGAKLGSIDEPFHAIPFFLQKTWDVKEQQADGSFKWVKSVPVVENPASPDYNDNWKWEDVVNGVKVQNIRRFNFYMLLVSEIEAGSAIPYVFSFKSTSIKEGKKLFTQMYVRNARAGVPPAAFTLKMAGKMVTNAKGSFVVPSYSMDRKATPAELQECLTWLGLVRGGQVRVDDREDEVSAEDHVGDEGTGEF
jgi:hypothetical protein